MLDFPNAPLTNGQTFTNAGVSWTWDGTKWLATGIVGGPYAPIASPVFTGDPQAPTPATADNDTSIATTAWVKSLGYAGLGSVGTTGQIQYTDGAGHFLASDWTTSPGLLLANNGGLGNPTFTTRSPGTRVVLWSQIGPTGADYAIGMASSTLWFSVPTTVTQFQWFAGTTLAMMLSGTGNITQSGAYHYFANATGNVNGVGGCFIYSDQANTVLHIGTGNGAVSVQDTNGNQRHSLGSNGVLTSQQFVSTLNPQYRMLNVNAPSYGSMWYNDGTTTYLLLTAVNDPYGTWNGLRPYVCDNATGLVTFGQWVNFNSGLSMTASSASAVIQCNNGGNYLQMFDDGNGHIECNTNLWINGNTAQGVIVGGQLNVYGGFYPGQIYMPNNVYLWWLDTNGSARYGLILANDNQFYLGDGSLNVIIRAGSAIGGITMTGNPRCTGGTAGWIFQDRSGALDWQWYGTGSVCRLWSSADGDRVTIDRGGNMGIVGQFTCGQLNVNGGAYLNGGYTRVHGTDANDSLTITSSDYSKFLTIKPQTQNDWCQIGYYCGGDGWGTVHCLGQWYYDSNINCGDFYSRGNVNTPGSYYCNGLQLYNNGGWWWTPNSFHSDGDIRTSNDVWCSRVVGLGGGRGQLYDNATGWAISFQGSSPAVGNTLWYVLNGAIQPYYLTNSANASVLNLYGGSGGPTNVGMNVQDAGNTTYCIYIDVVSDIRLKTRIRDSAVDALAALRAIPIRAFDWRAEVVAHYATMNAGMTDEDRAEKRAAARDAPVEIGMIAQEIVPHIPNGVRAIGGRLSPNPPDCPIPDDALYLDDSAFLPYLVRAIQQLADRLERIEARYGTGLS